MIMKMDYFFLIIKISSQVSYSCHFIMNSSNHDKILRIYSPSMGFLSGKSLFKMFLTRTYLFFDQFSNNLLHILRHTKCSILTRTYFIYI